MKSLCGGTSLMHRPGFQGLFIWDIWDSDPKVLILENMYIYTYRTHTFTAHGCLPTFALEKKVPMQVHRQCIYTYIYTVDRIYIYVIYTLWQTNRAVEKGPLIVFHGNMLVYQRVHEHLGYNPKSNKAKGRRHDRYWGQLVLLSVGKSLVVAICLSISQRWEVPDV